MIYEFKFYVIPDLNNSFFSISLVVLQRIMGGDVPPGKVQEIKSDTTQHLPVVLRDDSMLLYGPDMRGTKAVYEIVLHKPFSESMNTSYR